MAIQQWYCGLKWLIALGPNDAVTYCTNASRAVEHSLPKQLDTGVSRQYNSQTTRWHQMLEVQMQIAFSNAQSGCWRWQLDHSYEQLSIHFNITIFCHVDTNSNSLHEWAIWVIYSWIWRRSAVGICEICQLILWQLAKNCMSLAYQLKELNRISPAHLLLSLLLQGLLAIG